MKIQKMIEILKTQKKNLINQKILINPKKEIIL